MVAVVTEGLHKLRCPTPTVFDPTGIRGELFEILNHGLRQILNAAAGADDVALGDQDGFVVNAKRVPIFGVMDSPIGNLKVVGKVFHLHRSPSWLETLTGSFLAVPVPSHVGPLVAHAESSLTEYPVGDSDFVRGQIGSGGRRVRHAALGLGLSLAVLTVRSNTNR